jgi:outer membrane biosynthesis protein TonB
MAIRFDGMIDSVEVKSWSGHSAIEPTAKRLVKNAEPCLHFPDDVRYGTDVLHVVTTINFVKPANGPTVVTIDRPWAKAAS